MIIEFGKHRGKDISEVPLAYIKWAKETLSDDEVKGAFIAEYNKRTNPEKKQKYNVFEEDFYNIKKVYKIVKTEKDRKELESHIKEHTYISFDTETNSKNPRNCKMIGFSVSGASGVSFYYPLYKWNGDKLDPIEDNLSMCDYYLNLLKNKKLMMWNASFDIQVVYSNFKLNLTEYLWIEGVLIRHTIKEDGPFALKVAGVELQEFIGLDVKELANKEQIELYKNIEKNGGSVTKTNLEMYKADLNILGNYACADADLTRRICVYYLKELREQKLEDFFFKEEVMPLYKEVTVVMESKGVNIDMDLIEESRVEIEKDIKKLRDKVIDSLWETDYFQKWLTDKATEKFPVKNTGPFGQLVAKEYKLDLPKTKKGLYSLSKAAITKLPDSDIKEFFLGNISILKNPEELSKKLWIERNNGPVNVSSKPQMSCICFDYMGESPLAKTEKGKPKFDVDLLKSLSDKGIEWANNLYNYNRLIKIRGTYIERFIDNSENGKYFFSYKQHGTISGRYGSDAQQLPRPLEDGQEDEIVLKYNNRIRKFFISGNGRVFVDCDYESLEPHVFAHISGDKDLIDIFNKGHDFYSTIAIATERLQGYSADKKADNYLGKLNKQKRQTAKEYALGVPYGMGDYALGKTLGIPTEEAAALIEKYLKSYPDLKKWMDNSKKEAQQNGYVVCESGRIRHLPRVKQLYNSHKDNLLDFRYRNKLKRKVDKDKVLNAYRDYKNGINNSRNVKVQGMAASIVNRAAIAINRAFKKENIDAYCCAQIHDQLIVNIPEGFEEHCMKVIQDLMENTTKLSLKLKAPPELARNWSEGH